MYFIGVFIPLVPDLVRKFIVGESGNFFYLNGYYFRSLSAILDLLFILLFSSLPFLFLAIYAALVFANDKISMLTKNRRTYGILAAFIVDCLYVVWSVSPLRIGLINIFPVFSFAVMPLGYVLGILLFDLRNTLAGASME